MQRSSNICWDHFHDGLSTVCDVPEYSWWIIKCTYHQLSAGEGGPVATAIHTPDIIFTLHSAFTHKSTTFLLCNSTQSIITYHSLSYTGSQGAGAYPSCHWARGERRGAIRTGCRFITGLTHRDKQPHRYRVTN